MDTPTKLAVLLGACFLFVAFGMPTMSKTFTFFVVALLLISIVSVVVVTQRNSQLAPRAIIHSINGTVVSSNWVTDPEYTEQQVVAYLTTAGTQYRTVTTTNYYWHVWKIFQ